MKCKKFKSIRNKITFLVTILCVIVTIMFLISSSYFATNFLERYIDNTVARDSEVYSENIGNWVVERTNEAKLYAKDSLVKSMDWNIMSSYLVEEAHKKPKEYYGFIVADKTGEYRNTVDDVKGNISDRDYFKKCLQGYTMISSPIISKVTGKEVVVVTTPIKINEEIKGVFGIGIDLMNLYGFINKNTKYGDGKYVYIIDDSGTVVIHPQNEFVEKENITKETENIPKNLVMQSSNILNQKSGKVNYKQKEEDLIAYYNEIPNTNGWKIIIATSKKTFFKPIIEFVMYQIIIAIAMIILATISAKVVSKKIADPIVNLAQVFNKAANGDLTVTADECNTDEVGKAAANFNKMMKTVGAKSYLDPLTNVFSRESITDRIKLQTGLSRESGENFAVLFIGIDKFKKVNDRYGHKAGDSLLKLFAEKLKTIVDRGAIVGRITGDEFLVMLFKVSSHKQVSDASSEILNMVREPWNIEGTEMYITASIGVAIFPQDSDNESNLIKCAGVAKSKAKDCGGNNFQFYNKEMNEKLEEQLTLDSMLHIALEKKEFVVHYQPFIGVQTGKIQAVEALIRWNSSQLGMVSPVKFIPRAEENGLIIPIGNWVLKEACKQNKQWQDKGFRPICVSVNVSPHQFEKEDFVEIVKEALEETKLESKYLELEITEGVAMGNVEDKINKLLQLKELGVKISIDDFGTGYSSLGYLKRFPIDNLKIDQTFVRDIENENSKSIISTIVSIANNLRLGLVAEGVETVEQFEFIRDQKCQKIQGYLFSKPLDPGNFEGILKEDKKFC